MPKEKELLANKTGANRLGFAIWLKFFQQEGKFPSYSEEVPKVVINYVAKQVKVEPQKYDEYDSNNRAAKYHRHQIREFYGFRCAKASDASALVDWLLQNVLPQTLEEKHLEIALSEQLRELRIEPMTLGRMSRIIRSAVRTFEAKFCQKILEQLSPQTCAAIDQLLETASAIQGTNEAVEGTEADISLFHCLNNDSGRVSLESLLEEIEKLKHLRQIKIPEALFQEVTPKILQTYYIRAATETCRELRRHPDSIRYTLVAIWSWQRIQQVTDNLVDLLLQVIQQLSSRAERRVTKELTSDLKQVNGKNHILYRIALAALANPDGRVKDVIYPLASQQTLENIVREFQTKGTTYRQKVHYVIRNSYSHHYRQMVPPLLEVLEFRSNNQVHQPVIEALQLLKKYATSKQRYYQASETVPFDGIVKSSWREILVEQDSQGNERLNRINYEICVLQALRERLRCKEIWVEGANRYRNPEADLPKDFEIKRTTYYQALQVPTDVEDFILPLQQRMKQALVRLNENLPSNPKVKLLAKQNGWINLSPLSPQAQPVNLRHLKTELIQRWPMTSLLDVLKEADLRLGLTELFKTTAVREVLEPSALQKRLLLCLYGLGTNTGLKRVSNGILEVSHDELRYIQRRYLHRESLRQAIIEVVNATLSQRNSIPKTVPT